MQIADPAEFRVRIGGADCTRPYMASIFNISAMSFGALSANAIRALNKGARLGVFAHDAGEETISPYLDKDLATRELGPILSRLITASRMSRCNRIGQGAAFNGNAIIDGIAARSEEKSKRAAREIPNYDADLSA